MSCWASRSVSARGTTNAFGVSWRSPRWCTKRALWWRHSRSPATDSVPDASVVDPRARAVPLRSIGRIRCVRTTVGSSSVNGRNWSTATPRRISRGVAFHRRRAWRVRMDRSASRRDERSVSSASRSWSGSGCACRRRTSSRIVANEVFSAASGAAKCGGAWSTAARSLRSPVGSCTGAFGVATALVRRSMRAHRGPARPAPSRPGASDARRRRAEDGR